MITPETVLAPLGQLAPGAIKLALLATLGLILGRLGGRLTTRAAQRLDLDGLIARQGLGGLGQALTRGQPAAQVLGKLTRWLIYGLTVMALAQAAGVQALATLLERGIAALPNLVTVGALGVAGLWAAGLTRSVLERLVSERRELESPKLIAQAGYYGVISLTISTCASQLGLKVTLVQSLIVMATGGVLLGAALALALGGAFIVEETIARYYIARAFSQGEQLSVGPHQGVLTQLGPLHAILKTPEGYIALPYSVMMRADISRPERARPKTP